MNDHLPDPGQHHHDIYRAASVAEIQATLAHLNQQEAHVTARLNDLIASQEDLSRELGRLDLLRAHLGTQVVNTRAISNGMLSDAAATANRISSAVKRLDNEQSNVKATLEVVEQVAELKACVLGVHGSMGAPQDWETAASYLNRASKIPPDVVNGSFAEEIVPTAEVPDPPRVTLENAAESLCGLFLREFEKAAKEGDGTAVTRFFKLFPLIGRSDVGLDAYGRYVCHGVSSRARTNLNTAVASRENFFYANALTKLFEHIAQIVGGHEPVVERHYGSGMMGKVIERLQMEADVQGGIILDTWRDERNIDRKLTDIKSYAFSFLVRSFLPAPSGGTPRSGSPAQRDRLTGRASEDEGVDMKEVDGLLGETAVMLRKWSLYTRFLATKTAPEPEFPDGTDTVPLTMPDFLSSSNLAKKVNGHLLEPYNIMATFFFRRSVEKAFQLDESPADLTLNPNKPLGASPPFVTSAVDDVMYIVNQVLQRSISTSQRGVVSNVVPTIGRVLGSDFVGMIQRKMRDDVFPKAAIQGGMPPEDTIIAFFVLLNNLDVANDYIKRIVESHIGSNQSSNAAANGDAAVVAAHNALADEFPFGHDAVFVENSLKAMEHSFEAKTTELISDGIRAALDQIMKPRMRTVFTDAFRDINYTITPDELETLKQRADEAAAQDPTLASTNTNAGELANAADDLVRARFDRAWSALTRPIKRILTDRNFERLLAVSVSYLSKALEKRIWAYYGRVNEFGAVRLERDVAGIVSAAVAAGGRYALRDAFQRCTQLTMVMNMEEDEWAEIEAEADEGVMSFNWVLDRAERQRARAIVRERGNV
ncbi:COG4 transport protein-domain-containing protein [Macrophomina phaseolina]|uniref:Conserved oligomeric Golgi complex subunit 4 n=1 Tax=Macrophomina phaseolina TaxID=35725 RepID=A0ABQ8GN74_9PEZI|nr:COG4 transport protein-domain-containing protein [Macrophomina phaseolina]